MGAPDAKADEACGCGSEIKIWCDKLIDETTQQQVGIQAFNGTPCCGRLIPDLVFYAEDGSVDSTKTSIRVVRYDCHIASAADFKAYLQQAHPTWRWMVMRPSETGNWKKP